jgi:uncharacterized protein YktA (UPF0223 family)
MKFAEDRKLGGQHCTVRIDPISLIAKYIINDDICVYQLEENVVKDIFFDRNKPAEFSFYVPKFLSIVNLSNRLKITYNDSINMVELESEEKSFKATVPADDNHMLEIEINDNLTYSKLSQYSRVIKAIKSLKGLASDLSATSMLEFDTDLWTVSVAQCALFGSASGLKGEISSSLFERIYDYNAEVSMVTDTKGMMRGTFNGCKYYVTFPVKKNAANLPGSIPRMVTQCEEKVCDCILTNDVSSIIGSLLKSIKKEPVIIRFSDGRLDMTYENMQWNITTIKTNVDKSVSIKVPNKMLTPVTDMLSESTQVFRKGEILCLMRGSLGMLLTGIIC